MATYPNDVERLQTATPLVISDEAVTSRFNQGAIASRSRHLRRRSRVQLNYMVDAHNFYRISNFMFEEARGTALTFDFTFPYPHTGATATATTPIIVTTRFNHGLLSGEYAFVQNIDPGVDGAYQITKLTDTSIRLNGSVGAVGTGAATVAIHYPRARFTQDTLGPFEAIMGCGPPRDDQGLVPVQVGISEF